MSQSPSAATPARPHRGRRRPRPRSPPSIASRAAASASLPACPAPSTQTVPPSAGASARIVRAGGADVVELERGRQRQVVGHRPPRRAVEDVGGAGHLDLRRVGVEPVTASSRSGVSVSERERDDPLARPRAGRAVALADGGHRPEQDPARVGLGVVHLAARARRSRGSARPSAPARRRSARGCCEARSSRGRAARPRPRARTAAPGRRRRGARPAAAARRRGSSTLSAPSLLAVDSSRGAESS